ncbi:MAG: tRNA(Ile)(2)-agmatinylcytidine synthase [Archaeoglobaceae archaeon]
MEIWVGLDDTDSPQGMCTTYLALLMIEELEREGFELKGFPRLVRLNPTIPFKTRGNGAVSFLIDGELDTAMDVADRMIQKNSQMHHEKTNPGVVFANPEDDKLTSALFKFSNQVLKSIATIDEADSIIKKFSIKHLRYKSGRGLIGALAAVGVHLSDFTLERLAYRSPDRFDLQREVEEASFYQTDSLTYPHTWDTVDHHNKVVVSVPNSPDPVLFGIRGDNISSIQQAFETVKTEPIDKEMTFVTNQGTDMHLIREEGLQELKNYHSYRLRGEVVNRPYIEKGGHVFFFMETRFGVINCAAFEPTKQFREVIEKLLVGDRLVVYGSMKKDTINLEKISLKPAEITIEENPSCPLCGKKMESAGRGQGFRCKNCKTSTSHRTTSRLNRDIEEGFYEVPPVARRHISKPLVRMNVDNKHVFR